MTPVYRHGWGFDARIWDAIRERLGGIAWDRGYFGNPSEVPVDGPVVLIGHSLGALLWLQSLHPAACAIVAINGFDRLAAASDWPGVPVRVLEHMRTRFRADPAAVLASFRQRCGTGQPAPAVVDRAGLQADLDLLASADIRTAAHALALPFLVLDGSDDPILPKDLHCRIFEGASSRVRHTRVDGGHLLPLTDPDWCAERIAVFMDTLR